MQVTKRRDTPCELALRSALHRKGLRFRVDRNPIPRIRSRADVVFVRARVAVFVDGCFWHSCPQHGTVPKANRRWWRDKLAANRERDARVTALLSSLGWKVFRVWAHEVPEAATTRIVPEVRARRGSRSKS
jgi:DNA mismatch endonuclease (patch repair protein)